MTMHDDIEARLQRALAVTPSPRGLRWLDERVAGVTAGAREIRERRPLPWRMFLRPLPLAAAFLVLTGAVVGTVSLLERTVDATPGWRTAWDRAEVLGMRQTDAGYTLTLERAYVDLNQVMVFIDVDGAQAPLASDGTPALSTVSWTPELRGPTGAQLFWSAAAGPIETDVAAIVQAWGPPEAAGGTYRLTISCVEVAGASAEESCADPNGLWEFEFELPDPMGTSVATNATATRGDVTVTLAELRVSPTMVSARMGLSVGGRPVAWWATPVPISLRHEDVTFVVDMARHVLADGASEGPESEFSSTAGAETAAGTWEVEIPTLDYGMTNDEMLTLDGPWTITVTVP